MNANTQFRWLPIAIGLVCAGACPSGAGTPCDTIPLWSMGILEQKSYGAENRFSLWSIEQEGLHITGQCTYYQVEGQTPAVRKIDGTKTGDSTFWPDVTSQVFNEETKKWETISEPFKHGHRGTVTIRPGEVNQKLFVSLDVFLPFVTRYKTGRLVLETGGEIATFPLSYLLEDSAAGQPKH